MTKVLSARFDEKAEYAKQHFKEVLFNQSPILIQVLPARSHQMEQKLRRIMTPKFQNDISEIMVGGLGAVATLYGPLQDLIAQVEHDNPFEGPCRFFVEDCGLQVHRDVFIAEFFLWVEGRYVQLEQDSCGWDDIQVGQSFASHLNPDRPMTKIDDEQARDAQGNLVVCEPSSNGYLLLDARRQITHHVVNGLNEQLEITVLDAPGHGGACHEYQIVPVGEAITHCRPCFIHFQNGPIKEHGVNGISNEALLAVLIDRLEGFQSDQFACHDNQMALDHLQSARLWLHKRTLDRVARGVEGRNKA